MQELIHEIEEALEDLPIAFFSMQATNLVGVFTRLIQSDQYDNNKLMRSAMDRASMKRRTTKRGDKKSIYSRQLRKESQVSTLNASQKMKSALIKDDDDDA